MSMKKIEEQRFEFVLFINNHIICQRYFNIRDYNEQSVASLEMKELMDTLVGMNNGQIGTLGIIPTYLKNKSKDYLWANYNPYAEKHYEDPIKNIYEKVDNFQLEIKVDKRVVAKGQFSGNLFPPKVRYQVDVRELIPQIISEIRYSLSQKKYETEYADITL